MRERAAPAGEADVKRALLVVVLLATGGWGWDVLRAPDPDVDRGNGAYKEGKYAEALGHYDAAQQRGDDPRIQFDRGAALYKLGEQAQDPAEKARLMEQAEQAFERAADTGDARLKSDAYQALGNTLYQRERYEEAVDKYRRALRADPQNDAARHNLEMALRHRQKQPQQQPQQGQQQGQPGQQGQQQGQPQQGQQGQQQGQPQDPQQGQPQDPQQGQGQGQPQPQDPQQQGQGQPQQDPQQGQGQGQQPQKDPTQGNPNAPKQDPGQGQPGQPQQQDPGGPDGQDGQRPGDGEDDEGEPPSDEDQKLDALERRSRDLRKRLLRKGSRTRDPLRLPSRKDW
ncbi:MAG TPA: tetratricopeptide repeat protein [Kofleriaceae bacterium]|nr:tetratricopeptide repeat protein [Kofleriaceae bacterium]